MLSQTDNLRQTPSRDAGLASSGHDEAQRFRGLAPAGPFSDPKTVADHEQAGTASMLLAMASDTASDQAAQQTAGTALAATNTMLGVTAPWVPPFNAVQLAPAPHQAVPSACSLNLPSPATLQPSLAAAAAAASAHSSTPALEQAVAADNPLASELRAQPTQQGLQAEPITAADQAVSAACPLPQALEQALEAVQGTGMLAGDAVAQALQPGPSTTRLSSAAVLSSAVQACHPADATTSSQPCVLHSPAVAVLDLPTVTQDTETGSIATAMSDSATTPAAAVTAQSLSAQTFSPVHAASIAVAPPALNSTVEPVATAGSGQQQHATLTDLPAPRTAHVTRTSCNAARTGDSMQRCDVGVESLPDMCTQHQVLQTLSGDNAEAGRETSMPIDYTMPSPPAVSRPDIPSVSEAQQYTAIVHSKAVTKQLPGISQNAVEVTGRASGPKSAVVSQAAAPKRHSPAQAAADHARAQHALTDPHLAKLGAAGQTQTRLGSGARTRNASSNVAGYAFPRPSSQQQQQQPGGALSRAAAGQQSGPVRHNSRWPDTKVTSMSLRSKKRSRADDGGTGAVPAAATLTSRCGPLLAPLTSGRVAPPCACALGSQELHLL